MDADNRPVRQKAALSTRALKERLRGEPDPRGDEARAIYRRYGVNVRDLKRHARLFSWQLLQEQERKAARG